MEVFQILHSGARGLCWSGMYIIGIWSKTFAFPQQMIKIVGDAFMHYNINQWILALIPGSCVSRERGNLVHTACLYTCSSKYTATLQDETRYKRQGSSFQLYVLMMSKWCKHSASAWKLVSTLTYLCKIEWMYALNKLHCQFKVIVIPISLQCKKVTWLLRCKH